MDIPDITKAEMVFGTVKGLPAYSAIPEEFKNWNKPTKWNKLFTDWFFMGLKSLEVFPKEGVDKTKALGHIKAIMSSFEPKQEHKEAGVAYLCSTYFEDAKWELRTNEKPRI